MTELKSCPFCGGKADVLGGDDYFYYVIQCCNCHACAQGKYCTEAEAIAAWNTRAERTCENTSGKRGEFVCSKCHDAWRKPAVDLMNYCPNCGARVKN